ncbi:RAD51-associated protein 1 isoform X2 [Elgaria multicarinata webbii]|uniref:RAD51-associated protein 1 isoform X2 n=1 Tax=Elgaria multicarinata webbii TaxID=159646 RepID=UPI002FCCD67B
MARPGRRNKKIVDYSQFGSADNDDEDFAYITVPSNKKSKNMHSESAKEKMVHQKKAPQKEIDLQKVSPNKKALDDKLYQRNMEIALALSMTEPLRHNPKLQDSQEQVSAEESEGDSSFSEDDRDEFVMKKKTKEKEGRKLCISTKKITKNPPKLKRNVMVASGSHTNQLGRVPVKSPTQSLRLGLSRLAKVKPLHQV